MKLKGKPNLATYVGTLKMSADDKGFIETTDETAIRAFKFFGFEEVKEEKKEPKKEVKKTTKKKAST